MTDPEKTEPIEITLVDSNAARSDVALTQEAPSALAEIIKRLRDQGLNSEEIAKFLLAAAAKVAAKDE